MSRLTERITEATIELSANANPFQYNGSPQRVHMKHPFWNVFDRLCKYEDAEEQGLLLELPVAIGEIVYRINEFAVNPLIPMAVISFEIKGDTDHFKKIGCKELCLGGEWTYRFTDIGKTVFLTRSEAEETLAKMGGKA